MGSMEFENGRVSKRRALRKDNSSNDKTTKFEKARNRRVYLGGISKQRRRNDLIGILGEIRVYVLEEISTKEIIFFRSTGPSKDAKEKIVSSGYRILATYHADDKGGVKLPEGMVEREVRVELF